jgi:hypothetical protein
LIFLWKKTAFTLEITAAGEKSEPEDEKNLGGFVDSLGDRARFR